MTVTRLTLAVGSLASLLARSCYTKHVVIYHHQGLKPGEYIAKIAAGGNQGNRTRNHRVLSEIYRVSVSRKEAREWKIVEMERTVQRNGPWNGTERFTLFLGKSCRRATQTEQTVFLEYFLDVYRKLDGTKKKNCSA